MRDWLCSHYYVPCAVLILLGFAGFLLYLARRVRMKDMIMITVLSAIIAISRGVFFWIPQFGSHYRKLFWQCAGNARRHAFRFFVKFYVFTGTMDSVSDAQLGTYRYHWGLLPLDAGKNPANDHRIFGDGICVWPNSQFCVAVTGDKYTDVEWILDDGSEWIFV